MKSKKGKGKTVSKQKHGHKKQITKEKFKSKKDPRPNLDDRTPKQKNSKQNGQNSGSGKMKNSWKQKKNHAKNENDENVFEEVSNKFPNEASTSMVNPEVQDYSSDGEDHMERTDTQKLVQKQNRKNKKSGGFQAMGLSYSMLKGITRKGYKVPTPIQRKTIPIILDGKDVVAMARTGSGKTAAFLIPMFEKLHKHSAQSGARALILSPTRELAIQTLKFTKELGKFTGLRAAVVLGGDRMDDQFAALHENPDIILATPGRFMHVVVEMDLKLKSIEYVVFDEADRLFEMGFQEQLTEILNRLPESRQTLLFSATLPKLLVDFAKAGLHDPTLVRLDVETKISEQLKMCFLHCRGTDKLALLIHLLKHVIKEGEQTVVFAATKHHVEYIHMILEKIEISSTYIYSSLDPTARKINIAKFQHRKAMVLVVTDLAARGIDIPLLDNVINFHFPAQPKLFVHRVGRVARAGRTGTAYSLVSPDELAYMFDLHLFLGRPVKYVPLGKTVKDEDGLYGMVPQAALDDFSETLHQVHAESYDINAMVKVCSNAFTQYLRSRQAPAPESIKRVKEMENLGQHAGMHPIFESVTEASMETERMKILDALKSYKANTTIFEINSTSKTSDFVVMKQKRSYHEDIIDRKTRKMENYQGQTDMKTDNSHTGDVESATELDLMKVLVNTQKMLLVITQGFGQIKTEMSQLKTQQMDLMTWFELLQRYFRGAHISSDFLVSGVSKYTEDVTGNKPRCLTNIDRDVTTENTADGVSKYTEDVTGNKRRCLTNIDRDVTTENTADDGAGKDTEDGEDTDRNNTLNHQNTFSSVIGGKRKISDQSEGEKKLTKKQKREMKSTRDEENYISYRPADFQSEIGLRLGNDFDRDVAGATFDLTGDDEDSARLKNNAVRWDRKKKRYMKVQTEDPKKKKIRTESGAWISASYKSNAYKDWLQKSKQDDTVENDEDDKPVNKHTNNKRFVTMGTNDYKHRHNRGPNDTKPGKKTGKFRKPRSELKRPEQILKQRKVKAKKQAFQQDRQKKNSKKRAMGGKKR